MVANPITLEDVRWKAYWDLQGHHEIKPGDTFPVTPSGSTTIFYRCNPLQEEDGKWYSNALYFYEMAPSLIAGVYKKDRIYSTASIMGSEDANSFLDGKVEEIAFWGKSIGIAGLVNYQTNSTGMIGPDVGDIYADEAAALADNLYYYFSFDEPNLVAQNFTDNSAISVKMSQLAIGSGKFKNATVLDAEGDYISVSDAMSENELTMNIRFYMESNKDFVVYDNPEIMKIVYDEVTSTFIFTMYPYIGEVRTFNVEFPNLKVHHWYDFGVLYENGRIIVVIDGDTIETNVVNLTLGGVESIKLHHANVESVALAGMTGGLDWIFQPSECTDPDPQSQILGRSYGSPKTQTISHGGARAMDMLLDRVNGGQAMFNPVGGLTITDTILDEISDLRQVTYQSRQAISKYYTGSIYYYGTHNFVFSELPGGEFSIYTNWVTGGNSSTDYIRVWVNNKIPAGGMVRATITFKDVLVDDEPVFPMVTLFPGTQMKVVKHSLNALDWHQHLKDTGPWGTYTTNYGDQGYPAFQNKTGKAVFVFSNNNGATSFVYVPNNYICYTSNGGVSFGSTTYDVNYRKVTQKIDTVFPGAISEYKF